VFDLPHVVPRAVAALADAGLAMRTEVAGGDFFDEVPPGGDVYLLSWILHDWDDTRARQILESCRRAIAADGRLLVIESCVPPGNEPHPAKSLDLIMLVALGGRERSEIEYGDLLASAGFRLTRVVSTGSPMSVLEAVPV
jgi:hypothetical protein